MFQTQLREMEQELRTTCSLARTSSTGGPRVRGIVQESLANRLGYLTMETGATAPVAPSSDVRARLGTDPPPRTRGWRADLADWLIRAGLAPRPCLGGVIRLPQQLLLRQQDNRRAPCRRRKSNQTVCCSGTVQIPVVGDNIRQTCRQN